VVGLIEDGWYRALYENIPLEITKMLIEDYEGCPKQIEGRQAKLAEFTVKVWPLT
jgi:hypothetical protein